MREFLFRGKTEDGEWVEGYYYIGRLSGQPMIYENKKDGTQKPVDPDSIGEFTGLTDKNGKKIFEGDIVKWDEKEWGCSHNEVVEWDYALFDLRKNDWGEWCEVIGNIYDNPDFLENVEVRE